MAIETQNPGFIDSQAYAIDPNGEPVPDAFHHEYDIGMNSYVLSTLGAIGPSPVVSVFGRAGAVVAVAGDYDSNEVDNVSGVTGATVSDALDNLEAAIPAIPVTSVFGRTGAVVGALSDYDASQVDNDSTVVGATVKDALETLATNSGGATVGNVWQFDIATGDADPGSGKFRYNNGVQSAATFIYVSDQSESGADMSTVLLQLDAGDRIYIQNPENPVEYNLFNLTGPAVDAVGYVKLPVSSESFGDALEDSDKAAWLILFSGVSTSSGLRGTGVSQSGTDSNAGGTAELAGIVTATGAQSMAVGHATGSGSIVQALQDSGFAFGDAASSGTISGGGIGGMAVGRAQGSSSIVGVASSALAVGYVESGGRVNVNTNGSGSLAVGLASGSGQVEVQNSGAVALGWAVSSGNIFSSGNGAIAGGNVNGLGSLVLASSSGSIGLGAASGGFQIRSTQFGTVAAGYAVGANVEANGAGSIALGRALNAAVIASAAGSTQIGEGTNSVANSVQIGSVLRVDYGNSRVLLPNIPTSDPAVTDAIWSDNGVVTVSGGGGGTPSTTARAWVYVEIVAGTPTIQSEFNVSSITDRGVGQYTVVPTANFGDANFAVTALRAGTSGGDGNIVEDQNVARSVSAVGIVTYSDNNVVEDSDFSCVVYGNA